MAQTSSSTARSKGERETTYGDVTMVVVDGIRYRKDSPEHKQAVARQTKLRGAATNKARD